MHPQMPVLGSFRHKNTLIMKINTRGQIFRKPSRNMFQLWGK